MFSTPPISPHSFFDSLEDLPPRTNDPPPPRPSFESIKCLANQQPPLPAMEPPLPLLPPQLLPLGPNNPFPRLTHEMFCEHCQRNQVIVDDLHEKMSKVGYFDDVDYLKDFENEFPSIVYNDALTSKPEISSEPMVNRLQVLDFENLTKVIGQAVTDRIRMDYLGDDGQ
ncbi:hypothetical protein Tco_0255162, partial [Tanacetum coccineum]